MYKMIFLCKCWSQNLIMFRDPLLHIEIIFNKVLATCRDVAKSRQLVNFTSCERVEN